MSNFENNLLFRFDLIIKYLYIKWYCNNYNTDFFKNLYKSNILTFNNAKEKDNNKNKIEDFVFTFNNLIENIKKNGFNNNYSIPIFNNLITNGAHRFSICYFLNIQPTFISSKNINTKYDYYFFKNRKLSHKMSNIELNFSILEALKLNKELRCLILFPYSFKYNDKYLKTINLIKNNSYIFYDSIINLSKNGLSNFVKELYRNEKWIGGLFPKGINAGGKYNYVVDNDMNEQKIHLFIIKTSDIIKLKKDIRNIYNYHHCVHNSDFYEDTFRIASSILNNNSLHFLNNTDPSNISNNSKKLLELYFNFFKNKNNEDFCITSSIILELYNLRKANDIDYLNVNNTNINIKNISCHKDIWLSYYDTHKDNIIYNPNNYFYFNGFKFASLNIIKNMKKNRNEKKDLNDILLINNIII